MILGRSFLPTKQKSNYVCYIIYTGLQCITKQYLKKHMISGQILRSFHLPTNRVFSSLLSSEGQDGLLSRLLHLTRHRPRLLVFSPKRWGEKCVRLRLWAMSREDVAGHRRKSNQGARQRCQGVGITFQTTGTEEQTILNPCSSCRETYLQSSKAID